MRSLGQAGLLVCTMALAVACGPAVTTPSPDATATSASTPRAPDMPLQTPPSATAAPATVVPVVVPDAIPVAIFESVLAEAARLSGVPASQIALVRAEPAEWSDGSLGCPRPGELYTQALVNGYWVVFRAGAEQYDFRVANDGSFRLCEADSAAS